MIYDGLIIVSAGVLGGIANCLLVGKGGSLLRPRIEIDQINPGFLGNIFMGIFASLVVYNLAPELSEEKRWIMCLLAAAGGGNVITSLVQRQGLVLQREELKSSDEKIKVETMKTEHLNTISRDLVELIKEKLQAEQHQTKHPE